MLIGAIECDCACILTRVKVIFLRIAASPIGLTCAVCMHTQKKKVMVNTYTCMHIIIYCNNYCGGRSKIESYLWFDYHSLYGSISWVHCPVPRGLHPMNKQKKPRKLTYMYN